MSVGLGHLIALGANMNYSVILTWAGMGLHTDVLALSYTARIHFIYFPPIFWEDRISLVYSFGWMEESHIYWVFTVLQGLGTLIHFGWIFSIILLTSSFTDDKTESKRFRDKVSYKLQIMELGFELRPLWGHPVPFPLHHREKWNVSL